MTTGRILFTALVTVLCSTSALVSAAYNCEATDESPYKRLQCDILNDQVKSKEPVCKDIVASATTALLTRSAANLRPASLNPAESSRDGKKILSSYLNGCTSDENEIRGYLTALGMLAIPAAFFLFVNINCCCFCTCCHSCCKICSGCRFCKCIPRDTEKQYTSCERNCPVGLWFFLSLLFIIFASLGMTQGIFEFNDSMVGGVCQLDNWYERISAFTVNVKVPLNTLNKDFKNATVELEAASIIDPQLSQNVKNITTFFSSINKAVQGAKDSVPDGTTAIEEQTKKECDAEWDAITEQITKAQEESVESAENLDTTLQNTQNSINDNIVQMAGPAAAAIKTITKALDDFQEQVDATIDPHSIGGSKASGATGFNLFGVATIIQEQRTNLAFGAFGQWFIAMFFGFIAIIGMKLMTEEKYLQDPERRNPGLEGDVIQLTCMGRCCSRFGCCSWWLVLLFGIFSALIALATLPIAAVGRDLCQILPTLPRDLGKWQGAESTITRLTNTCWNQTGNLFDGFDAGSSIDVSSMSFTAFDEAFASPEIDTAQLIELNKKLDDVPDKCDPDGDTVNVQASIDATIVVIKIAEHAFGNSTIVDDIKGGAQKLVDTIEVGISGLQNSTGCYFVACGWQETVDVLCVGMVQSLGWIATAELLLAVLCVPFAITVMIWMMRHGGHGPTRNNFPKDDIDEIPGYELSGAVSPQKGGSSADKYAVADAEEVYDA